MTATQSIPSLANDFPCESVVRVEQLEEARKRIDRELLEWKMQVQLAEEAVYSAWISEGLAEDEDRSVAEALRTLEAELGSLPTKDGAEALSEVRAETFSTLTSRLEALRERQLDARLKLQICRRHRQLQNTVLEQARAAMLRAEQRSRAINEEVAALRHELEPLRGSVTQSWKCFKARLLP